jgi:RHS repeat-associated protein
VILLADLETPSSFRRSSAGNAIYRRNGQPAYRAATAGVRVERQVPSEDPYGRTTKVSGSLEASFQYAGYYQHAPSGVSLTLYRAYDPTTGKWQSRDPIAERGGINLYDYVGNDPIDGTDPLGLKTCWKHVLMTTFGDSKGDDKGYMGDNLKPGDLAVGNGAANSSNRYPSKSASNGPGGLTIPYNTPVFVDPNHSSPYNGTVKDYGAYDIDHPSTGKGDWVDRWNPNASRHNQSDHGWISIDVDDCKSCPSGWSEAPRAQPVH